MRLVFSSPDLQNCIPCQKLEFGLLWKTIFSLWTPAPCRTAKCSSGFFLESTRRATKCKNAEARAQHQRSKTVGPFHSQVKAKILRQKEVCPRRASVRVGNAFHCRGLLTPPLVQRYIRVSVNISQETHWKVACQTSATSSLHLHSVASVGLELTPQWHTLTNAPIWLHVFGLQVSLQILLACDSNLNSATVARLSRCLQIIIN